MSLAVNAEQTWTEQQGSRITGFRSDHDLAVTLRDLASAGRILGEVLVAGGDDVRLNGVEFVVEDDGPLRVTARQTAWYDALDRATQLATLAGRRLGAVQQITEQSGVLAGPDRARDADGGHGGPRHGGATGVGRRRDVAVRAVGPGLTVARD